MIFFLGFPVEDSTLLIDSPLLANLSAVLRGEKVARMEPWSEYSRMCFNFFTKIKF